MDTNVMDAYRLMVSNDRLWSDNKNEDNLGLGAKDATWFLEILEAYNITTLSEPNRTTLQRSQLRQKIKHQVSILFQDDVDFVIHSKQKLVLDETNPKCSKNPGKWMIHQACKFLAEQYSDSILAKEDRSCIWSALMERTAFYLQRSGFNNVYIDQSKRREAAIVLDAYRISRSNFTKVFKRYCR